jgi:hypothetical protein
MKNEAWIAIILLAIALIGLVLIHFLGR